MNAMMMCLVMFGAPEAKDPDLKKLADWMAGHFDSAAQAEADKDFYNISLIMHPIWTDRTDGFWFYVEQAVATSLDRPYRQRVYQVRRGEGGTFESVIFAMDNPLDHAGVWKEKNPLVKLSPDDLKERIGCTVVLHWKDGAFVGGTQGKACESSLRGASYATSEISVHADRLVSWDRGYDANDQHVWGAEKGGYVFVKKK